MLGGLKAHGKVLLTGEYVVLDGAQAIALPSMFGQSIEILPHGYTAAIKWIAKDNSQMWFEVFLDFNYDIIETNNPQEAEILSNILKSARILSGNYLPFMGKIVVTDTDYPRAWGLGSSSTLIALVALYTGVNPYNLLRYTFGGSGFDVACAFASGPILFQKGKGPTHLTQSIRIPDSISKYLYFIYSEKKQKSSSEVERYTSLNQKDRAEAAAEITALSQNLLKISDISVFRKILDKHEEIISQLIGKPTLKNQFFSDFPGTIKSLGAWGGDFFLAVSPSVDDVRKYFNSKGLQVIFPYSEFIYEKRN